MPGTVAPVAAGRGRAAHSPMQSSSLPIGVLLGAVTGALALGEAFVFGAPGGAALRVSLYLLLGTLLAVDRAASGRRPLAAVQGRLVLGVGGVAAGTLLTGLLLGGDLHPRPVLAAAPFGWAAAQTALALDGWRAARSARWPRLLVFLPGLAAALLVVALGAGGRWDVVLAGWRPAVVGLLLGGGALAALARLVRRHGQEVLATAGVARR